jgi:hypothetical protein
MENETTPPKRNNSILWQTFFTLIILLVGGWRIYTHLNETPQMTAAQQVDMLIKEQDSIQAEIPYTYQPDRFNIRGMVYKSQRQVAEMLGQPDSIVPGDTLGQGPYIYQTYAYYHHHSIQIKYADSSAMDIVFYAPPIKWGDKERALMLTSFTPIKTYPMDEVISCPPSIHVITYTRDEKDTGKVGRIVVLAE